VSKSYRGGRPKLGNLFEFFYMFLNIVLVRQSCFDAALVWPVWAGDVSCDKVNGCEDLCHCCVLCFVAAFVTPEYYSNNIGMSS
jgi:hypothetical protein